jgi:signal transduction histidine kinase
VATEGAKRSERQVVSLILASSAILLVAATAGFVLFRRWLLLPVLTLSGATRRIAEGHYRDSIPIEGRNEFARLARDIEAMSRDIADVQERLVEKERMAAVGEMTASVAHNVRNPLASIRAIAQTCRRDPAATESLRASLATVMETVDRADRWLKDLLNALRPVRLAPQREDLRATLEDVVRGARPFAEKKGVSLALELADGLPEIPLDRRHFEQAIIVLISNAVEASPTGATVTIRAAAEPPPGTRVRIEVEDRGTGMDEATRGKIFTPYFSTKKSGIGLGLSLAQKIVFGHRGIIDVDSAPGRGTRMTLLFPITQDPIREERRDGADPDPR